MRENPNVRYLYGDDYGMAHRMNSTEGSNTAAYTNQNSILSPREIEKKGAAIQSLLAAAEKRQAMRQKSTPASTTV